MTPAMIINRRGRMREDGDMKEYEQTSGSVQISWMLVCLARHTRSRINVVTSVFKERLHPGVLLRLVFLSFIALRNVWGRKKSSQYFYFNVTPVSVYGSEAWRTTELQRKTANILKWFLLQIRADIVMQNCWCGAYGVSTFQ